MSPELKRSIDELVSKNRVVVFMKGNRMFPQCGFSNTVVQVGSVFGCRVWVVGPCSPVLQKCAACLGRCQCPHERGPIGHSSNRSTRMGQGPGPVQPPCRVASLCSPFCMHACRMQIMNSMAVPYETVDVLADDKVRSGMKEYSQWPTFPQVAA